MTLDEIHDLRHEGTLMEKAKAFDEVVDWLIRNGSADKIEAYNEGIAIGLQAVDHLRKLEAVLAHLGYSKGPSAE